jgi:hypothetical protein
MIQKLRKIIAFGTSVFLIILSLGFYKPNFSGKSTIFESIYTDKSTISLDLEEEARNKRSLTHSD